jgi:serine/threonine-protein kinase
MNIQAKRAPDPHLPRDIGRFEAFLQIGAGGMARVYLAVEKGNSRPSDIVVLKVLHREVSYDEQALTLFMDEARIAMRLKHPNVILTKEISAAPPDYLLVMEFQDGQSLLQVLRRIGRQMIPLDEHIWILAKVLAGLSHAHELKDETGRPLGIVHRDVSPSNVLVCYSGEIKLLDFGIAKATGALSETQDGVVKGKLGYAAPEQCLGKPTDPRSDIYAVGVMLWEAIAGRRRASGETGHSVLQARIGDSEPLLEEVRPDAPPELMAIAQRALGHQPESRYPTAREFQRDLEAYLASKQVKIGAPRIAAMLRPHFEQDRAEQRRAIDEHLRTVRTRSIGRLRSPLPGPVPAPISPRQQQLQLEADAIADARDEDTSRIPVDDALLMKSRGGSLVPPAPEMRPTPTSPPGGPFAPPSSRSGAPASDVVVRRTPSPVVPAPRSLAPVPNSAAQAPITIPAPGAPPALAVSARLDEREELEPKSKAKPIWVVAAIAAVFIGVLVVSLLRHRSTDGGSTGIAAAAPSPHAGQSASAPAANTVVAPSATQVSVRVSVDPPNAELRLDGSLLPGNPFASVFPKGDAIHELSASADGFKTEKQMIQFLKDVDLQVSLQRGKGSSSHSYAVHAAPPAAVAPAAAPAAAPARAPSEARPSAVEPGMDLHSESRPKRNIDEKDPYAQ